jgi:xanthine dehydrogenase accessory factor
LAHQAVLIGFDVTVIDDRPEFTDPTLFPNEVTTRCGDIAQLIADSPIDRSTYVVIVTRGHQRDQEVLEACIHAPSAYLGMIGSKRKVAMVRDRLVRLGTLTEAEFDRVFTPIGLDIGGVTVSEIAVSIAAELIAVRRRGHDATSAGGRIRRDA